MSHTRRSYAGLFSVLAAIALQFTFLFALIAYHDKLFSAMRSVPESYAWVALTLFGIASLAAFIFGGETLRPVGMVGVLALMFGGSLTLALRLPQHLAPMLMPHLPAWPTWLWVVAGVGVAIGLMVFGVAVDAASELR